MIWYILCHTTGSGSQPAAGIGRPAPPLTTREGTAPPGILAGRALGGRRASMHCPLVTLPFRGQSPPRRKPSTISLHAGTSHLPSRLLQRGSPAPRSSFSGRGSAVEASRLLLLPPASSRSCGGSGPPHKGKPTLSPL